MNALLMILVGIVLVGLVVFLVAQNIKDEEIFEKQMNNDYHKTKIANDEIL